MEFKYNISNRKKTFIEQVQKQISQQSILPKVRLAHRSRFQAIDCWLEGPRSHKCTLQVPMFRASTIGQQASLIQHQTPQTILRCSTNTHDSSSIDQHATHCFIRWDFRTTRGCPQGLLGQGCLRLKVPSLCFTFCPAENLPGQSR